MDITVTFRHVESTESLKEYAEEKLSKIDKYFDYPIEAHIVLTAEKFRRMADVTLNVNGAVIKAEEETEDMYSAIDQVMDKIEIQVKRYRAKIRNRRSKSENQIGIGQTDESLESGVDEPGIEVEKLVAKPMDPEEAAMQFTMSQQDFLVFRNSRSGEINVIHKRKDGNLGLIEPAG
ncbi:MAG: ribosome-associated translation inhibitor RaiA [Desulfobacteraceae bacterium]|jgi:putative sigma-54 modulation protein